MKNILYLDFMYYTGHVRSNKNFIKALGKFSNVYALSQINYFDEYKEELNAVGKIRLIEKKNLNLYSGQLLNRISSLKVMLQSALLAKKIRPDYIFVSSFDTIAFKFGRFLFGKTENMYLLHTINIDELSNNIKKKIFDAYKNKVNHVVFEQYMKDYLINKIGVESYRVFVLPHPLNENSGGSNSKELEYACVGLSNSNDEELINTLIELEREKSIFKNNCKKVILKSKEKEFDNGYLKVFKGFLDKNIYDNYINKSECVIVPFPKVFRYRMSGTLVDAFSNNKIVLGNDIPIIQTYAKKYPDICKIFINASDVAEEICLCKTSNGKELEFDKFKMEHSNEALKRTFMSMFK